MTARLRWLALVTWVAACRNTQTIEVPNRVLDRPLDATIACVRRDDDAITVVAPNVCSDVDVSRCDEEGVPQLVGFVVNSEKNQVGMFRRCDVNGMVDLDPETPGYDLVPVGTLPSKIAQTSDCRVVTANVGSCDLSAIEMPELARYAVGLEPTAAPSSLVSTIVPRLSDGTPLGAAPGDLIAVPAGLSLAEGQGGGATGQGVGEGSACDPEASASVYVTFPACQLIAEVSLATQRILQSRQFVTDADGTVTLVDSGPDPQCPIECPLQFEDGLPDRPEVDPGGVFPVAMALVDPAALDTEGPFADVDANVDYPTLFLGGTGSDEVFELEILRTEGGTGVRGFAGADALRRLQLEDPAGISAIRPTPPMSIDGRAHQFLYVVVGDGSTRVVDRRFDRTAIGVECDTQVDPSQASDRACHPIDPGSQSGTAARRPFAAGPGIRGSDGSTITDWTFVRTAGPAEDLSRNPLRSPGVVGIGVTSLGRAVMAVFSAYDGASSTISRSSDGRVIDPIGLLNVEIRPHMLWPVTDPESGEPSVFPLVSDAEPDRSLPAEDQRTQVLAPTFRRVDRAYVASAEGTVSEEQQTLAAALGDQQNVDQLSQFDEQDGGLYTEDVVRVAVRDYRQWRGGQTWSLSWEPEIPGTRSSTGRIECEDPSDYGMGTCHVGPKPVGPDNPDGDAHYELRLVDEGATFCDEGVLPGDRLVVFGCAQDGDCGLGQRCLRETTSTGSAPGICVSAQSYEEDLADLRKACAPFITDPCGPPRREYLVTDATQTELTLAATDIPAVTWISEEPCPLPAGELNLRPGSDGSTSDTLLCLSTVEGSQGEPNVDRYECEARLSCVLPEGAEQPPGGCAEDSECDYLEVAGGPQYICFDGLCRTPCEGGSFNCRQALLPGPGCFAEFFQYAVTLRESFAVGVASTAEFLSDRVITDPLTGQCREDETVSALLTSRIPIGADAAATFARIPDCANADEAAPSDPNPCRITVPREADPRSRYHYFSFYGVPVDAIRYSNPFGTVVIDTVDLISLASPNDLPAGVFSPCFAGFHRSRIPANYRESFTTPSITGYAAYNSPIVVGATPLTYPVRVLPAPETEASFAVDAGGRGGVTGVRGQVVRMVIGSDSITGDQDFRVR